MRTKKQTSASAKAEQKPEASAPPQIDRGGEPFPPEMLLELAKQEQDRRPLRDYYEVICELRDVKKFTFREIAEWLNNHNVDTDHNAVYREYTRAMPDSVAEGEALADRYTERAEGGQG
jgi:hypothetical protein